MKQYHLHPDKVFIIRENDQIIGYLEESEISQFAQIELPEGCTEILITVGDDLIYATINKSMEGLNYNPIQELISKENEIIEFYHTKNANLENEGSI